MKTRNKMKKLEQEKFVVPKTVQNVIPIKAVYKDGIFLVGKNMNTGLLKNILQSKSTANRNFK